MCLKEQVPTGCDHLATWPHALHASEELYTVPPGSVAAVATFALIHGGGGSAWDWHLVAPALRERGHEAVAVDLPIEDESAGWQEYSDAVVQAVGDRRGVVVVGRHRLPPAPQAGSTTSLLARTDSSRHGRTFL